MGKKRNTLAGTCYKGEASLSSITYLSSLRGRKRAINLWKEVRPVWALQREEGE